MRTVATSSAAPAPKPAHTANTAPAPPTASNAPATAPAATMPTLSIQPGHHVHGRELFGAVHERGHEHRLGGPGRGDGGRGHHGSAVRGVRRHAGEEDDGRGVAIASACTTYPPISSVAGERRSAMVAMNGASTLGGTV